MCFHKQFRQTQLNIFWIFWRFSLVMDHPHNFTINFWNWLEACEFIILSGICFLPSVARSFALDPVSCAAWGSIPLILEWGPQGGTCLQIVQPRETLKTHSRCNTILKYMKLETILYLMLPGEAVVYRFFFVFPSLGRFYLRCLSCRPIAAILKLDDIFFRKMF